MPSPVPQERAEHVNGIPLARIPTGFSMVPATDTNSTMSGVLGPGRAIGSLMSSAGKRLEQVIDRFAERRLRLGPNMAALRLASALHEHHLVDRNDIFLSTACRSEYTEDMDNPAAPLLKVCYGFCSQCGTRYITQPLDVDELSSPIQRALDQLFSYIRYVHEVSDEWGMLNGSSVPQCLCTAPEHSTCSHVHSTFVRFTCTIQIFASKAWFVRHVETMS
jgi:hypothetical protein